MAIPFGLNSRKNVRMKKILSTRNCFGLVSVVIFILSTTSHWLHSNHWLRASSLWANIAQNNQVGFENSRIRLRVHSSGLTENCWEFFALSAIVMGQRYLCSFEGQFLRYTQHQMKDSNGYRVNGVSDTDSYIKLPNKSLIKSSFVFVKSTTRHPSTYRCREHFRILCMVCCYSSVVDFLLVCHSFFTRFGCMKSVSVVVFDNKEHKYALLMC